MQGKIEQLTEALNEERELREAWIEKYDREQADHTQSHTEILMLKSREKDFELELSNLQIKCKS